MFHDDSQILIEILGLVDSRSRPCDRGDRPRPSETINFIRYRKPTAARRNIRCYGTKIYLKPPIDGIIHAIITHALQAQPREGIVGKLVQNPKVADDPAPRVWDYLGINNLRGE